MVVAGWETMRVEITQPVQTNVDEVGPPITISVLITKLAKSLTNSSSFP